MKTNKQIGLSSLLIATLLLATIAFAAGETTNQDFSEYALVKYSYFYPQTASDYEVITTYGKLPELETEAQKQNWSNSLNRLEKSLATEIFLKYIDSNGNVLTYGDNSRGYFVLVFYKNLTIQKPKIDEIYAIIDKNAKEMGIQEFPVEFGRGVLPLKIKEDEVPVFLDYDFHSSLDIATATVLSHDWSKTCGACHESETQPVVSPVDSYKPEVVAIYGKLPEFKTEEQRRDWFDKVRPAILGELEYKTDQYFYPEGPLIALGDRPDGYIEVTVLENSTVEKLLMDKIYGMIDDEAKKKNVREVPVRFVRGDFAQNDETLPDKISDKSVTGFGLLAGFVSLFSGWLFRRK